jgi:hypothetical protein
VRVLTQIMPVLVSLLPGLANAGLVRFDFDAVTTEHVQFSGWIEYDAATSADGVGTHYSIWQSDLPVSVHLGLAYDAYDFLPIQASDTGISIITPAATVEIANDRFAWSPPDEWNLWTPLPAAPGQFGLSIEFGDFVGNAFADESLPSSIDLASFTAYARGRVSTLENNVIIGDDFQFLSASISPVSVPEPCSALLVVSGLLLMELALNRGRLPLKQLRRCVKLAQRFDRVAKTIDRRFLT